MLHALVVGLAAAVLIMLGGGLYQKISTARDRRRHLPPGKLVDVGGHRLHILMMGHGSPTVVCESGLMATVLTWGDVQRELAKFTRVVCYDRAGLGWSDASPSERTAERVVNELRTLLRRAEIPPPYVLVGHSFGGLTMRLFAAHYPEEVAGAVLVDPVVPSEWQPPDERARTQIVIGSKLLSRAAIFSRFGVIRFVSVIIRSGAKPIANGFIRLFTRGAPRENRTVKTSLFWNLPPAERAMAAVFWVQPKFCETVASQLRNLPRSAAQVAAAGGLGSEPVIVISAGDTPPGRLAEQMATARQSSRGRHLSAGQGGHWVMIDEPKLVIHSIMKIIGLARQDRSNRSAERPSSISNRDLEKVGERGAATHLSV